LLDTAIAAVLSFLHQTEYHAEQRLPFNAGTATVHVEAAAPKQELGQHHSKTMHHDASTGLCCDTGQPNVITEGVIWDSGALHKLAILQHALRKHNS
jgi:hypothetical protein